MSESIFNSLAGSLHEASEILLGDNTEFRKFVRARPNETKIVSALAVCMVTDDEELIPGKLYNVCVLPSGKITVKDECGETLICDSKDFVLLKFQPALEKRIKKIVDLVAT